MSQSDEIWRKLTTAARQASHGGGAAPYGFSSRVAARAFSGRGTGSSLIEQFALRAFGVATLVALLALITHFSVPSTHLFDDETLFAVEDPAAIVLGVNDNE